MTVDADPICRARLRHKLKRLAIAMDAPLETVRTWLYRGCSSSRRREMAAALAAEIDREIAELVVVKASLARLVEEYEHAPTRRENHNRESATTTTTSGKINSTGGAIVPAGQPAWPVVSG